MSSWSSTSSSTIRNNPSRQQPLPTGTYLAHLSPHESGMPRRPAAQPFSQRGTPAPKGQGSPIPHPQSHPGGYSRGPCRDIGQGKATSHQTRHVQGRAPHSPPSPHPPTAPRSPGPPRDIPSQAPATRPGGWPGTIHIQPRAPGTPGHAEYCFNSQPRVTKGGSAARAAYLYSPRTPPQTTVPGAARTFATTPTRRPDRRQLGSALHACSRVWPPSVLPYSTHGHTCIHARTIVQALRRRRHGNQPPPPYVSPPGRADFHPPTVACLPIHP